MRITFHYAETKKMITVGIPTHNEEKTIAKCINSVLKQISKNDQIIVVASGCTDNTVPEIKKVANKDKRVRLIIEKERKGKASALNLIIKNARSSIIVQSDGDVVLARNAVADLVRHFKNPVVGGVSGHPIPVIPKKNLFYEWTMMSYRKMHELRRKQSEEGTFWHLSGYLLAFRKKALKKVPFAKGAVDAWMGKIIKEEGYKMIYEPKAKVFVKCPTTVKDFINQKARVRAGYYFISSTKKAPRGIQSEIFYFPQELVRLKLNRWPAFFVSALVYTYTWFKGWYFFKKNKSLTEIWKRVSSTK